MVSQIYPSVLQFNKDNASDTKASFLNLHLFISNDINSSKIYDKSDYFDFPILEVIFLALHPLKFIYISHLIQFARASSYDADFNTRNKLSKLNSETS